jgi:hypothetical protein
MKQFPLPSSKKPKKIFQPTPTARVWERSERDGTPKVVIKEHENPYWEKK